VTISLSPHGLEQPTVDDGVNELREAIAGNAQKLRHAVLYAEGPINERPAPGVIGREYRSTDETPAPGRIYKDIGTAWARIDAPTSSAGADVEALRALGTAAGQALPGNHASVTNARTPTTHAASHAAGGSDRLYTAGSSSGATGGTGWLTLNIAHGLGMTPSRIAITPTSGITANFAYEVSAKSSTHFTVTFTTSVSPHTVHFEWQAFR
jgi:hypothetical protein